MKDGWRALYCILKYNLPKVPVAIQFLFYLVIGGFSAIVNQLLFMALDRGGMALMPATATAFLVAAAVNYYLSIKLLFRHKARWKSGMEMLIFLAVVAVVGVFDVYFTKYLVATGMERWAAKAVSTFIGLFLNFGGRRFLVFPEKANPDWKPQVRE
jgi:putative flippase GtrA